VTRSRTLLAAAAGVAAVLLGLGAGAVIAGFVARAFSPLTVVGAAVIDLTPAGLKEAVIHVFGSNDKTFLLTVLAALVVVLAGVAGALEERRPWVGRAIILVGAAVGVAAALTRADATVAAAVPSVVTGVLGAWLLAFLLRRMPPERTPRVGAAPTRRSFLTWAGATAALGLVAAVGGELLTRTAAAAANARAAFRLPRPQASVAPPPAATSLGVPGITPLITANSNFYRTDTELVIPQLDPAKWSLRVHGMVERPFTLDWNELTRLPMEEHYITLACVSNEVGGDLISTAKWLGYPVRLLLERAGVTGDADMVFSKSFDGWTAATPLSALNDPNRAALLAIGMNGEPLPFVHGFPARLVTPGLYGYVSATKWVTDLEVTRFADRTSYWTKQGWAEKAPIKIESRIDVPRDGRRVKSGHVWVAGVAWDQHVGISKVEVQVDDGAWHEAELARELSTDTWVQWRWAWQAAPGNHRLTVRATSTAGELQTTTVASPVPNGASGLHSVGVSVSS